MSVRRLIVEVDLDRLNVTEFCRAHEISTWLFYDLRRRYAAHGEDALEPRSRAPKRVANRTPEAVRDRIVELRKTLDDTGLDAGPASIQARLQLEYNPEQVPSEATIWRVLRDRGFITPDPRKAPKHAHRSFTAARANECWQIDATKWALTDGTIVEIIDVVDDCTRVCIASTAVPVCNTANTWDTVCHGAQQWGWPARVLTDNALAFTGGPKGTGGLAAPLRALGIGIGHSRPFHPQTCGKVERFHQTLKQFLTAQPPADTLEQLQTQLDVFAELYNHHRPHRSLQRRTPAAVFADTPKDGPATHPLGEPTQIYRSTVGSKGHFSTEHAIQIYVGRQHHGTAVTTIVTGASAHVFAHGRLLRSLTIDPTRKYQGINTNRHLP